MHPLSRSTPGSSSCRAAANNTRSRTLVLLQHSRTNRFLTTLPSSLASRFPPSLTRPAMSRMGRQTIHSLETISLPSFFGMSVFFFVSAIAQRAPVSLAFGTPLLRLDLVDPNIKFTPTFSKRAPTPGGSFTSVPILGSLAEQDFIPRNSDAAVSFSHVARLLLHLLILLR